VVEVAHRNHEAGQCRRALEQLVAASGNESVLAIEFEGSEDQKVGVVKTRDLMQRYL